MNLKIGCSWPFGPTTVIRTSDDRFKLAAKFAPRNDSISYSALYFTSPLTIVVTAQPFRFQPLKGEFLPLLLNCFVSTFFSFLISKMETSASAPSDRVPLEGADADVSIF